jgi:hypothetical protein
MNHSLYQDGILKPSPFKRLPWVDDMHWGNMRLAYEA